MADTPEPQKRPQHRERETEILAVLAILTTAASIVLTTLILTGTLERIAEISLENALGLSALITGLTLIVTGGTMTTVAIITLAKRTKGERRLTPGPLVALIAGTPIIAGGITLAVHVGYRLLNTN